MTTGHKRKAKPTQPAPERAIEWTRADPDELAKFDPASKLCTMNCGPSGLDPRSRAERMLLCDDCETVRGILPAALRIEQKATEEKDPMNTTATPEQAAALAARELANYLNRGDLVPAEVAGLRAHLERVTRDCHAAIDACEARHAALLAEAEDRYSS